ncbi:MAG: PAS domain S-box protein, partial [Rhodopirellula sp.]|nr:PAS domain S-box protein [Rhodopirellula sp.]
MSDNRSCVEPVPCENHFATLYEEAPLGYQSLDAQGRVLQVNRTWLELLGYARDEVIGRSFADFLTVAQRPCFAERFARFKAAGEVRGVEFEMVRKDGGTLVASFDGRIARDEHGRFLRTHCIFSDVTERKRAETDLRNRESLLEKIFDILPIGLWFVDKDGKLTRGNPAGIAIWGAEPRVAPADYGVFKARRLPSGEDIAPNDWALAHTIRDGVTIVDELLEIDAFDGKKKIILNSTAPVLDDGGAIQGAIVVNQDITERWKAEQALRESALRQAMAVQAGNVGLWDWDLLTNKVVYSREWKSQIGYEADEISDSFEEWRSRVHPEDLGPVSNEIQTYIAQRRPDYATEFRFRHKDGSFRWIMAHASVVTDDAGRAVRVMGAHIDLTEQKRAEAARRQSDERYRRIVEMANEGFLVLDADDRVTFANRRMAEMLGYPESVLEGRPVTDLVAEEELADHRARMEKRRQGCDDPYERRLRRRDGGICHALVSASAIH